MGVTSDRNDPDLRKIDPVTNMQESYLVLSDEERARGFVRPLRSTYVHVGRPGPRNLTRDLTDEERETYSGVGYVVFEEYPEGSAAIGRFWTQDQLDRVSAGCGGSTTMGVAIAATYARDPSFYGGTYCATCRAHFPVGADGEFTWSGTDERVGT